MLEAETEDIKSINTWRVYFCQSDLKCEQSKDRVMHEGDTPYFYLVYSCVIHENKTREQTRDAASKKTCT